MSWRNKYRLRDKKRASKIPTEEFAGILDRSDDFPSGHFLIGDEEVGYRVCLWNSERGLYNMRSHDNAYYFAMVEYLLANGALRFASTQEAEAFAVAQGWAKAQA